MITGAEAVLKMLEAYGVRHIFGLCGDTSLPLYDALYRQAKNIQHILTRDERSAAYMADVYARLSKRVGVCEGPSGGGATYILPGVVEANDSSSPLLAITTDIATGSRGRFALTELDQLALFKPVSKWNAMLDKADALPRSVRVAFRQMTTGKPGAVHLGFPFDTQKAEIAEEDIWIDARHGAVPAQRQAPAWDEVERMAECLRNSQGPILVCGGGPLISGAETEVRQLAELIGAPVATTISGKGIISDNHPLALGVVGSNGGTPQTRHLLAQADVVLFIGCRAGSVTTERWRVPVPGKTAVLHIDIDPSMMGTNYPTEVALVGDAKLALQGLCQALGNGVSEARVIAAKADSMSAKLKKFNAFFELANSKGDLIRPEAVVSEVQKHSPEDCVIVADPGTPCPYFSAYFQQAQSGRRFVSNRAHGALGYALPGVVGAQFARPNSKCIAVMGDGSFGFACGELETIARLNLPVILIVISNAVFGWIKAGQKYGFEQRYFSVDFKRGDHAAIAKAFGLQAWRVEQAGELGAVLRQAFASDQPTLVDIICQPLHEAKAPVSEWVA